MCQPLMAYVTVKISRKLNARILNLSTIAYGLQQPLSVKTYHAVPSKLKLTVIKILNALGTLYLRLKFALPGPQHVMHTYRNHLIIVTI